MLHLSYVTKVSTNALWSSCILKQLDSLTGPVGQPFASCLGGQRFASWGCTQTSGTGREITSKEDEHFARISLYMYGVRHISKQLLGIHISQDVLSSLLHTGCRMLSPSPNKKKDSGLL